MSLFHFLSFGQKLSLEYIDISPKLFHESLDSWLLNREESIDVNEVISYGDLILIVGLVEIFIKHLNEGLLGVQLSLIVLWVNVDFVAEFLGFSDTHDFTPIG